MAVTGSCTPATCGAACCKVLGVPASAARVNAARGTVSVPVSEGTDWMEFMRARGATIQDGWATVAYRQDVKEPVVPIRYGPQKLDVLLVKHVCAQLDDDKCKLHGTDEKPAACKAWPTELDDLSVVPGCGYRIEPTDS